MGKNGNVQDNLFRSTAVQPLAALVAVAQGKQKSYYETKGVLAERCTK
jgi:hypothetical protein